MVFRMSILKACLLWLTTGACALGALPQFDCLCANGNLKHSVLIPLASASDCCCPTLGVSDSTPNSKGRQRDQLPRTCCSQAAEQSHELPTDTKVSGTGCKKKLTTSEGTITSLTDVASGNHVQMVLLPLTLQTSSDDITSDAHLHVRAQDSGGCRPPTDLVITLRHLVI